VLFDEIDNCEDASGALGNTWSLVLERQAAASILHCKAVAMGTPNDESGTNWQEYLKSDMREYHEPCPLCGGYQAIKLGNIEVAQGMRDPILIRHHQAAAYRCTHCGELIEQRHQGWMADRGIWVPACQQVAEPLPLSDVDIVDRRALALAEDSVRWTPKLTGEVPINPQRGYRVWRANTKFEQCTWSNILARFLEVHKHPEQMKVFANAWLAEPWRDAVRSADVDTVRDRIGVYEAQVVPTRTKVVLGFVDVQLDCLWYVFRAFGPNQESWLIDFGTVEVHGRDHGAALDTLYKWAFYRGWVVSGQAPDTATAKALRMRAYAIAVDSGAFTDEVYEFARRGGVVPTKGRDQADFRVRASQVEGKKRPDPLTLYHLNTTVFKDRLQRLIQTQPGQPGEWHLHRDTTDEYVAQLTSEHAVRERTKGKARAVRRWMKKAEGIANHLLDCESGVLGLAEILEQKREVSVMTLRDEDPAEGLFRPGIVPSKPAAPAQPVGRIKGFEGRGGGIPRS
jgi:phage terminase large subunit GpA-like protein